MQRFWAKVDRSGGDDACWLWTATTRNGYGRFTLRSDTGQVWREAHRIAWELINGPIPRGMTIDHRHTCPKRCVNPAHLRLATQKQNNENLIGAYRNSRSGIRGVSWNKRLGKWAATVRHDSKQIHLGYYSDFRKAAEVARSKRLELFTHSDVDLANSGGG